MSDRTIHAICVAVTLGVFIGYFQEAALPMLAAMLFVGIAFSLLSGAILLVRIRMHERRIAQLRERP